MAVLVVQVLAASGAAAQSTSWIALETNQPAAEVVLDTVRLGPASAAVFEVAPGTHRVRLVPERESSWSVPPLDTLVTTSANDTTSVALRFPHYYRIESIPYGADVIVDAEGEAHRIGSTPLTYTTDEPLLGTITVEKAGYVSETLEPGDDLWNRHSVMLERMDRVGEDLTNAEVPWSPPRATSSRWIDYGALGLAVASALLTVHYKFKADDLYDRYERTGDPSLRPRIEALDTRAAIALGGMQVGLGVFAIRLALR